MTCFYRYTTRTIIHYTPYIVEHDVLLQVHYIHYTLYITHYTHTRCTMHHISLNLTCSCSEENFETADYFPPHFHLLN
jgi:hypothetical protein